MAAMDRLLLAACLLAAVAAPAAARPTLVCRVAARTPFNAAIGPGSRSTRIFIQTALLVEERFSGTSRVRQWTVVADTPDQLVAVDPAAGATLVIDRPGNSFAESGVQAQVRGHCLPNDLP